MKVLHLISSGGMYGAETVILDLSRSMRQAGHGSVLALFALEGHNNAELLQRAEAQSLETHRLPCAGQLDRTFPRRLRALVEATGADVVHAHGYKADVYAFWAMHGTRTPLVSTCHTWYDNDLALRVYGAIDRAILRRFQAVVAVSDEVEHRLLKAGVRTNRIQLIRNGVDTAPFARVPRLSPGLAQPQPPTVGLVGRFAPEKGIDVFLMAAALVREQIPVARFLIGGDGPDRPALEALRNELQLQDCASLPGRQEDMPAFYASLDVLVSASRQEGLPIALLEGMASGLPVVATRVGEIPKVVQDGRTGLLVPPEDPPALAAAIVDLLSDEGRRREFGENGRKRIAEEFSAAGMMADYLQVYERVLEAGRPEKIRSEEPRR